MGYVIAHDKRFSLSSLEIWARSKLEGGFKKRRRLKQKLFVRLEKANLVGR